MDPDDTLTVHFPGMPPRTIRVRTLATLMGDDDLWFEVERRLWDL
ncbi:hypothetical protein [Nocardioides sp. cx-169]|nr:hypothetical protein [Nocardioides sp. cx-169]